VSRIVDTTLFQPHHACRRLALTDAIGLRKGG